jgi:hypothetical protein
MTFASPPVTLNQTSFIEEGSSSCRQTMNGADSVARRHEKEKTSPVRAG